MATYRKSILDHLTTTMSLTARALLLAPLLALGACDEETAPADSGVPDSAIHLEGGGDDAIADSKSPADQKPDGPLLPGTWKTVQGTPPQLTDHTATLLTSGEVLIVGGSNSLDATKIKDAAHRYRPQQDDFVTGGKMTAPRAEHAAAILPDGRVLVTGGKNGSYLNTAEIFDPTKPAGAAWTAITPMYKSRWGHTATALKSGEVLIAGGFVSMDSTASIVLYDPTQKTWKVPGAMMKEGRRNHTATLMSNGKVLLAGGIQGASSSAHKTTYLDTMEIYDPVKGTFTPTKFKMSKKRIGHTATLLPDGKVFIVGGWCGNQCAGGKQVNDLYDPLTDTLSTVAHAGDLPNTHVAALLNDGRLLVVGDGDQTTPGIVLTYQPGGGAAWLRQPDMAMSRWSAEGILLKDGSVLVVGGLRGSNPSLYADKAERFVP